MVTLRNPQFFVIWAIVGLGLLPLAIGRLELEDVILRAPAATIVLADAALTLQVAIAYNRWVYPRVLVRYPALARLLFRPVYLWAGAVGYYVIAFWVLLSLIGQPDGPIPISAYLFLSGYAIVGIWKLGFLMAVVKVGRELDRSP